MCAKDARMIYWHGELPPLDAEPIGECIVEATSGRVSGRLAHQDELWNQCYQDLMRQTRVRMAQEINRLGGDCAHVLNESVDSKHNEVTGEAWLHGCFDCMVYRRPRRPPAA